MEIHGFDIIAILFIHFVGGMITLNAVNNALDNYEDITVEGMKSVTAIKFIQNNRPLFSLTTILLFPLVIAIGFGMVWGKIAYKQIVPTDYNDPEYSEFKERLQPWLF